MYTKKTLPLSKMLRWTRGPLVAFVFIGTVPVFLYDVVGFRWLHVPWMPLGVLGTAVAFIVGFKNNASYDRLWEARKIWGGIVNTSRSFTVMVKDFKDFVADPNFPDADLREVHRELVHRHVAWLTALRHQLRASRPWENTTISATGRAPRGVKVRVPEAESSADQDLEPYLSAAERSEVSAKGNQASQILGVQSRRLRELRQRDLLGRFEHVEMERTLAELYALQGKCERIKNFPYPRQFATLNYFFVWLFILLLPLGVMEEFETVGEHILKSHGSDGGGRLGPIWSVTGERFIWFAIPFSVIVSWVFYALELVGEHSENPFEGGPNDVPITDLSRSIEIDIRQLIDDENIPPALEWRRDTVL